jgi:TatD DNase family protein
MFDCHTHLHFEAFKDDSKEAINRALSAGVSVINVGTQKDTSRKAVEVANLYPTGVYASVGLHPTHTTKSHHDEQELGGGEGAKAFTSRGEEFDYDYYLNLARDKKVVAIGECGLDYYRVSSELQVASNEWTQIKERQKEVFLKHVKIAQETSKALMIHCRPSKGTDDAYEELLALLLTTNYSLQTAVLHFYVGSVAMTQKFLQAGFNFEFGGVITFTHDYDEQIKMIPLDRLLTETDSPYVAPTPYRGKRNESAYLPEVIKRLAEIKGVSFDEMAKITDENARRIFKINE